MVRRSRSSAVAVFAILPIFLAGTMSGAHGGSREDGQDRRFVVGSGGPANTPRDEWPPNEGPGEHAVSAEALDQGPLVAHVADLERELQALGMGDVGMLSVDWEANAIELHWKGQLPAAVKALVVSGSLRFPVRVMNSDHTWRELDAAARAVIERMKTGGSLSGAVAVAIQEDLEGLRIFLESPEADTPSLRGEIQSLVPDVPLEFVFEPWAVSNRLVFRASAAGGT